MGVHCACIQGRACVEGGASRTAMSLFRGPEVPVEVGADITGDGGVLKTILETGWRSPMFSDGDEVRCAEMFRSFNPVPHTTGASIWRHI